MLPKNTKFPGYDRVSGSVYLHEPAQPSDTTLLVCTWHNAVAKNVAKYAARYLELFPKYTIILLLGDAPGLFVSRSKAASIVSPAVDLLLRRPGAGESTPTPTLLAAVYSNGGGVSLTTVAHVYRARTGRPLPVQRTLLDSCPGSSAFEPALYAFQIQFRPLVARYPFLALPIWLGVWIALRLYVLVTVLTGTMNPIDEMKVNLDDERLFERGPRTFIYSKEDRVVPVDAITDYQRGLESKGWDVRREVFSKTQHVAHAVGDPDRYWNVVAETFNVD